MEDMQEENDLGNIIEKFKETDTSPAAEQQQLTQEGLGLKSAGAAVQGTALSTRIEANADPRKLLNRISTNQKDIVHKELAGKVAPIRPEGKESADESGYSMWTSEEIFRSVKDSRTEEDDQEDDNDSEPPPPPKPTAKEVFKAISLINNYIESDTSVAADKLNQSMETYSKSLVDHLITTARQTTITSFFTPANSS
ncbi:hypothetical protein H4Q26_001959 [Puccinia striiformis f. sp. tritici PST-130]|nr:hypothetical protein H4Q26_001959 [Puccinia striiformis f. sp. tritici PST-130]